MESVLKLIQRTDCAAVQENEDRKKIVDEYNISITPCLIERGEVTYYN